MKKISVFLSFSFFALLFIVLGFNAHSANASSVDGCGNRTTGFSYTTGQSCVPQLPTNLPAGCSSTFGYSPLTGVKCDTVINSSLPAGCSSTIGYSPLTGEKCDTTNMSFPPGCSSSVGFSTTTGDTCNGSTPAPVYLPGCSSTFGYSWVNGNACDGSTPTVNNANVYIISPSTSGKESWGLGTTQTIRWSLANYTLVNIDLTDQGGNVISNIAEDVQNNGSYNWTLPADFKYGAGSYRINISSADKGGSVSSYAPFNITAPTSNVPGCSSTIGWSVTTGNACDGSTQPLPLITTSSLPNAQVGSQYKAYVYASQGFNAYYWSVVSGSLPSGLILTASDDCGILNSGKSNVSNCILIYGTPTVAGTYTFNLQVAPSNSAPFATESDNEQFTLTVNNNSSVPGCSSSAGWSVTTGMACDGSTPPPLTCSLNAQATNIYLDGNNTAWGFDVTVNANNPPANSSGWSSSFQGYTPVVTAYGVPYHYGDFFVSAGPLQFTAHDTANNSCTTTITVNPPIVSNFPAGCSSTSGWSTTTGDACDGSTPVQSGCDTGTVFSTTTGESCSN